MTIPSSVVNALGAVLLHFVWQGTALAFVLGFALLVVPRGWARVRYLLACVTLAAMAAAPIATAARYAGDGRGATAVPNVLETSRSAPPLASVTTEDSVSPAPASRTFDVASPGAPIPWMDWFVVAWAIGVLLSAVRLAGGWAQARRLLREDAFAADDRWTEAVTRIAARLGIRRPVRLLESARVQVPIVIGALQPVLLLPASALSGLAPAQIEAVLAHELAHIRRHDYLINLLQSAVETLLFYHPAVWWVSHTIRVEREHCCDDLAVSACGDAVLYARALTAIETMRQEHGGLALAVSDGSLLARVRRLLGVPAPPRLASSAWVVAAATALLVAGAGLASHARDLAHLLPDLQFAEALEAQAGPAQPASDAGTAPATTGRRAAGRGDAASTASRRGARRRAVAAGQNPISRAAARTRSRRNRNHGSARSWTARSATRRRRPRGSSHDTRGWTATRLTRPFANRFARPGGRARDAAGRDRTASAQAGARGHRGPSRRHRSRARGGAEPDGA